MAAFTFISLLKTNPHKAYAYGKEMMAVSIPRNTLYSIIYANIGDYSDKLSLPAEVYLLGVESLQAQINGSQTADVSAHYNQMADFYWRSAKRRKAIRAERNAIRAFKRKRNISLTDNLAMFKSRLRKYKDGKD